MLNQVVMVGRLVKDIEIKEIEDGKTITNITLAIPRCYKNADGEYDTDFVTCKLWNNLAEQANNYCKKGDIVGVKGRLQTEDDKLIVIAEKITFLSTKKED